MSTGRKVRSVFVDLDDPEVTRLFPCSSLSGEELARAGQCCSARDRERFIARRSALRFLLSEYLGRRPEEITFRESAGGKPYVQTPSGKPAIHFSVSHSGGIAAFAFGIDVRVGIDIEKVDGTVECAALARQFFTPCEGERLAALKPEAFFVCWTRKEAYVKAVGIQPLDSFDVGVAGDEIVNHLYPHENGRWTVEPLDAPEGYKCSLCRGLQRGA